MRKLLIISIGCTILGASLVFGIQKALPGRVYLADKMYNRTSHELFLVREEVKALEVQEKEDFCTLVSLKLADKIEVKSPDSMARYESDCLGLYQVSPGL